MPVTKAQKIMEAATPKAANTEATSTKPKQSRLLQTSCPSVILLLF